MSSLLKQVTDDEAILLLYLAGELPEADRATVANRLNADSAFRGKLDELRETNDAVTALIQSDDANTPLPVSTTVAARGVNRVIRQWQVDRVVRPASATVSVNKLRYPWWVYPTASAAALFLAFLVWWGNSGHERLNTNQIAANSPPTIADPYVDVDAVRIAEDFAASDDHVSELSSMDAAADELAQISQGSDDYRDFFDTSSDERL